MSCSLRFRSVPTFLMLTVLAGGSCLAQGYELVWSDEFDGPEIDRTVWSFWDGGAFNDELQCYTDDSTNASIEEGVLRLVARREERTCRRVWGGDQTYAYTSARLESWPEHGDGKEGQAWRYGRVEVRARLPRETLGLWPAIWMMPAQPRYGGWPYSGEIDIMEYRSNVPTTIGGTIHYSALAFPGSGNANADRRSSGNDYVLSSGTFADDFHVFAIEWDAAGIRWFVDGNEFHEITRAQIDESAEIYPFDQPFYVILNLAVGGHYLPDPDDTTMLPQALEVDYVRIYEAPQQP